MGQGTQYMMSSFNPLNLEVFKVRELLDFSVKSINIFNLSLKLNFIVMTKWVCCCCFVFETGSCYID